MPIQRNRRAKIILKNKFERLTLYDFKTYCKTIVIKIVWHWHKYRWKN